MDCFGTIADIEIIKPVSDAIIKGKISASDVLNGFLISKSIKKKNALVAKVEDAYNSFSLYCMFSKAKGGVFFETESQIKCTAI